MTLHPGLIPPALPLTRFVISEGPSDRNALLIIDAKGKIQGEVAQGVFWPGSVSWSPDGHWIVFTAAFQQYENFDIYIIGSDGSELKQITYPPHYKYEASWSPDGKQLVYVEGPEHTDIVIMGIEDQKYLKLTYTEGDEDYPAWSPDGSQIAFLYTLEGYTSEPHLWVMDADGSNRRQVTDFPAGLGNITWSPDGNHIAFTSSPFSCGNIYVVDVDGSNLNQLTNLSGCAHSPTWSSDGKYIAYLGSLKRSGDVVSMGWQIHIMRADGSYDKAITPPEWRPMEFAWSPVPVLAAGNTYRVTEAGDNLNLRQEPSLASRSLKRLRANEEVLILEGPVDQDGYYWWKLRTKDGDEGWAVEFLGWFQSTE